MINKKRLAMGMAQVLLAGALCCACASGGTNAKTDTGTETKSDSSSTETDKKDASKETTETSDRETVFQVSLLQGLTFGDYHGSLSAKELKTHGDTGIGTFDGLNGELIMVDGSIYRAAGDGSVEEVEDTETIPFSNVTFIDEDEKQEISDVADFETLTNMLNEKVAELGENRFYMIRIDGEFNTVNARSEYAQEEPYEPLADVLEHDQTFFDYENVKGTVVGLYCPPYMADLNATGWHLHFVSDDRTKGGHVLGLDIANADITWDYTDGFAMHLPDNDSFNNFDLTIDQSEDIEKVEKKQE